MNNDQEMLKLNIKMLDIMTEMAHMLLRTPQVESKQVILPTPVHPGTSETSQVVDKVPEAFQDVPESSERCDAAPGVLAVVEGFKARAEHAAEIQREIHERKMAKRVLHRAPEKSGLSATQRRLITAVWANR